MLKSISCPTAEIIGVFASNIALAKPSSLKHHKSSLLPPPLAKTIASYPTKSAFFKAFIRSFAAKFP